MVKLEEYNSSWMYLLLVVSLITSGISSYYVNIDYQGGNWKFYVTSLSIVWMVAYFSSTLLCFKTVYLFISAYIVPLVLFHLGITIPDTLGLFDNFGWGDNAFGEWLSYSGYYTILALGCLGIGLSVAVLASKGNKPTVKLKNLDIEYTLKIVYQDGVWLFFVSMIFLGMAIYTFGNILNYSRVDFFRGVGDTRGLGVFLMTFPSSLILLFVGATTKQQKLFATIVVLIGFIFLLLSGYRAMAMFPVLVGIVVWYKTGRKVSTTLAIALIIFTVIAIPALSALRSLGSYTDISNEKIGESIKGSTVQETFRTLGQTGGVAAHVIRLVPDVDPHRWGVTYLDAIRNSVPNILPGQSENRRQAAKQKAFSDPSAIPEMIPSDWLTYRIAKNKFDRGEGVGFSGLIEPYLNFGYAGVVVFFLVLGFFLGRLEITNILYHPNMIVFCCAMYWPFARSVRNDIATFLKPAIFTLILLIMWRLFKYFFMHKKVSEVKVNAVHDVTATVDSDVIVKRVSVKKNKRILFKKK